MAPSCPSPADRFCLALAERLAFPCYTAERAWDQADTRAEVHVIR